jgi:predicted Zn-dependent peptidase
MIPMRKHVVSLAVIGCTALLSLRATAAPVSSPLPRYPEASMSSFGSTQVSSEQDADATVAGVQVFVAAGLDREGPRESGVSALTAECILRTPVSGVPLKSAIAAAGGSISYTVDGRSVHYYIEGRTQNLVALVGLLGRAIDAPDFSPATLAAAKSALETRIASAENDAVLVGIEMFRRSYYTSNVGSPALGSASTLSGLGSKDVGAFYAATYKRSAITASAVGRLAPELGTAIRTFADKLPDDPLSVAGSDVKPIPASPPRIIARRDVGAPWVVVGFAAPAPDSRDFGAMLVLESLLSDAFERSSTTTLGSVEKSIGATYLYDSSPASLVVYVNGALVDPSVALRELLVVSKSLSEKPIGADPLQHFKAAAEGRFLTDSVNLSDRSYLLGTFTSQGLGPDAINTALGALEATTSADVQRVAKVYLQRYIIALVLPRQTAADSGS